MKHQPRKLGASVDRKGLQQAQARDPTRGSNIYFGEPFRGAVDQSFKEVQRIPLKGSNLYQEKLLNGGTVNNKKSNQSMVIPASEKPYANLAQAIKESQLTSQDVLDHEVFPATL